ncbi:MAG: NAD(P)-dependent oxidoreductase [Mycobacterium sp.]
MPADDTPLGTLGFVGLGDLGAPMAANYARHGLALLAHDLRPHLEAEVMGWGGRWADNPATVVQQSDVLCLCLLDDAQIRAFVQRESLFEQMRPGSTLVVHSTVTPLLMQELAAEAAGHGVEVVDAPVSGSHAARLEGRLTVMVAASAATFDRLRPLWEATSLHAFRVADTPGSAQVLKLCNNMMGETNYLVALEALRIAEAFAIPEPVFLDVVKASSGNSWMTENWCTADHHMRTHPHGGEAARFSILLKDLQTAVGIGGQVGAPPLIAAVAGVAGEHLLKRRLDHITAATP